MSNYTPLYREKQTNKKTTSTFSTNCKIDNENGNLKLPNDRLQPKYSIHRCVKLQDF